MMDRVPGVQRFYFVKLLDDEVAARDAIADQLRDTLAVVVGVPNVTVGVPVDASAARWDLSVVIRAKDLADWERIARDPRVTAALDGLGFRATVVKAWTFAVRRPG